MLVIGGLLVTLSFGYFFGRAVEASLHDALPQVGTPEYDREIARRTSYIESMISGGSASGNVAGGSGVRKGGGKSYPPEFGGKGLFDAGITELRDMFATLGREEDVSQDPADLQEHGFSKHQRTMIRTGRFNPATDGSSSPFLT